MDSAVWGIAAVAQQGPPNGRGLGQLILPVAAVIAVLLLVIIIILLFPRLRSVRNSKPIEPEVKRIEENEALEKATENPLEVTLRLLNEDERRVVELLAKSGDQLMQKDISYELKLNRVKTHRVLVGLIERGVVTAEKHFNTNMITLADWLRDWQTKQGK